MMNAAVIIVVLTTLLIHYGHCQQKVTSSALQDAPKTLHSLNVRSNNNPRSQCNRAGLQNFLAEECGISLPESSFELPIDVCQQPCRDMLHAYFTQCNSQDDVDTLRETCKNAGSSAEAPTFVKALFLMTFIVMAMLLL